MRLSNRNKKVFVFVSLLLMISACSKQSPAERFKAMSWLSGTWKADEKGYVIHEEWQSAGDSLLYGLSFITQNTDTVYREKMSIALEKEGIYYHSAFPDASTGEPVSFKLKSDSPNPAEQIFESSQEQFPQKIVYTKTSDRNFVAGIEGGKGKDFRRRELVFTKE